MAISVTSTTIYLRPNDEIATVLKLHFPSIEPLRPVLKDNSYGTFFSA